MGKRGIVLHLDKRWYDALSRQLKKGDTTVEEKLDEYLDTLIGQLPERVRERISGEIWDEDQQRRTEAEASRHLSVFRVTQNGRADHLVTECRMPIDVLHAAMALRSYLLAKGNSTQRFAESLHSVTDIAPEVFQDYADEFLQRTGRVISALDIDLDRGEFSTLDAAAGWETYTIRDVCSAAWHANHNDSLDWAQRIEIFAGRLEHLGIAPPERLSNEKFEFQEQPEAAPFEQTM